MSTFAFSRLLARVDSRPARLSTIFILLCLLAALPINLAMAETYQKATEGRDVVKNKIYPKEKKIELTVPNLGFIMNQSYINTFLISGGINYYLDETWGLGVDIAIGSSQDKTERSCIENFYYDPTDEVGVACGDASLIANADTDGDSFPRFGPAYVPIREINSIITANVIWTPVYGKQLLMKQSTSYFDLFVETGLGIATSTFYDKRDVLANGNVPRDVYRDPDVDDPDAAAEAQRQNAKIGATVDEVNSYGVDGRPDPLNENHILINLGIGQKFHFSRMFHMKVYIRNMTLLGTAQGFDNLLAIYGGFGVRF